MFNDQPGNAQLSAARARIPLTLTLSPKGRGEGIYRHNYGKTPSPQSFAVYDNGVSSNSAPPRGEASGRAKLRQVAALQSESRLETAPTRKGEGAAI